MNRTILLSLALATAAFAAPPTVPATADHERIAAGATRGPGLVRRCGIKSPVKVSIRALSTPLVNQELTLEVITANGADAGPVRTWLRLPPGLEALEPTEWTDTLPHAATARHQTRVRVAVGTPLPITAKADTANQLTGEGYVTLYPLEVTPAGVRAKWSATNLRALDDQPTVIQLKSGERAEVLKGN